jgi:ribosomal 50S subunit-recycling heat shock protein
MIKRRTLANEICDKGRVFVNGKVVKAGYEVHVGDQIEVHLPAGTRRVVIDRIAENIPANRASELFHEV